ncbi:hypothetical protein CEP52_017340 [Fusarium oligoseptatum]|uniref:Uncharacterized protein n=1 Tax=Fusarium oligoseptatum TaxID=2604345 RepID=A0A428RT79_9HYPO|nr:hypothetical protein CEP52_017340 [Fusarium oligoseptatum]
MSGPNSGVNSSFSNHRSPLRDKSTIGQSTFLSRGATLLLNCCFLYIRPEKWYEAFNITVAAFDAVKAIADASGKLDKLNVD